MKSKKYVGKPGKYAVQHEDEYYKNEKTRKSDKFTIIFAKILTEKRQSTFFKSKILYVIRRFLWVFLFVEHASM